VDFRDAAGDPAFDDVARTEGYVDGASEIAHDERPVRFALEVMGGPNKFVTPSTSRRGRRHLEHQLEAARARERFRCPDEDVEGVGAAVVGHRRRVGTGTRPSLIGIGDPRTWTPATPTPVVVSVARPLIVRARGVGAGEAVGGARLGVRAGVDPGVADGATLAAGSRVR